MTQEQRLHALSTFRTGRASFLLATDLASRGIDVPSVDTVLNYEAPQTHALYLHRVGRTARAGRPGLACTLAAAPDRPVVRAAVRAARHHAASAVVRRRAIPRSALASWAARCAALQPAADAVLRDEAAQRALAVSERDLRKAENLVVHGDAIRARPRREWFESKGEKARGRERGGVALNGEGEEKREKREKGGKRSGKQVKARRDREERREGGLWKGGKGRGGGEGGEGEGEGGGGEEDIGVAVCLHVIVPSHVVVVVVVVIVLGRVCEKRGEWREEDVGRRGYHVSVSAYHRPHTHVVLISKPRTQAKKASRHTKFQESVSWRMLCDGGTTRARCQGTDIQTDSSFSLPFPCTPPGPNAAVPQPPSSSTASTASTPPTPSRPPLTDTDARPAKPDPLDRPAALPPPSARGAYTAAARGKMTL